MFPLTCRYQDAPNDSQFIYASHLIRTDADHPASMNVLVPVFNSMTALPRLFIFYPHILHHTHNILFAGRLSITDNETSGESIKRVGAFPLGVSHYSSLQEAFPKFWRWGRTDCG